MIEAAKDKVYVLQRKLARRFCVSKTIVLRISSRNGLVFRQKRKASKYTLIRLENVPRYYSALRRIHFVDKLIVIDDEKYELYPIQR